MRLQGDKQKPEIFDVAINGTLRGRAATGTYEKKRRGIDTILGAMGVDGKEEVLLCISEDGREIEVLRVSGEKRVRGVMRRVAKSDAVDRKSKRLNSSH